MYFAGSLELYFKNAGDCFPRRFPLCLSDIRQVAPLFIDVQAVPQPRLCNPKPDIRHGMLISCSQAQQQRSVFEADARVSLSLAAESVVIPNG
jgi:hypothetical protein